jgi:peptidyl-prolyl cis-trans isomerase C
MMTLRLVQSLLLCSAFALAGSVQAKPAKKSKVVVTAEADETKALLAQPFVTVNGEPQPNAWAEVMLREQGARGAADSPELRQAVRQNLVTHAAMAQEARKAGLHKNPLLQAQIELAQQNLLVQAWQQKVLADRPPQEDDIKAEYERQLASLGPTDYRLRHILVKDEATAKSLMDKIKAGAKLADLAQENSLDAQTRERGGASDWTNVSMLLPPLAEAIKSLANGQLAPQPVKTDVGWHVLQREESRPYQTMSYEQAKPQMQAIIARRLLDQRIKALLDKAQVK